MGNRDEIKGKLRFTERRISEMQTFDIERLFSYMENLILLNKVFRRL